MIQLACVLHLIICLTWLIKLVVYLFLALNLVVQHVFAKMYMDGRGGVSLHSPHAGGMTREQAEAAAKSMVESLHRAGRRAVNDAKRKQAEEAARAREAHEAEILSRAVQFLQLDIGTHKR